MGQLEICRTSGISLTDTFLKMSVGFFLQPTVPMMVCCRVEAISVSTENLEILFLVTVF